MGREDGRLQYNGGEIDVWGGFDPNFLITWTVEDLCKEHGYVRFHNIYWHVVELGLEEGLRPLNTT